MRKNFTVHTEKPCSTQEETSLRAGRNGSFQYSKTISTSWKYIFSSRKKFSAARRDVSITAATRFSVRHDKFF